MFDSKLQRAILTFLIQESNGNIVHIKGYKKMAKIDEIFLNNNFRPYIDINEKLIIECHCRNPYYFNGIDRLSEKVTNLFKTNLGVGHIELEYHYSMYYCRD